jgi:hypothetical protein
MIEIKSLIAIGFGGILLVYSLFLVGVNQSESDELRKKFEKAKSRYFKLLVANHELKQKIKVLESRLNDLGAKYSELNRQYEALKESYVEVLRNSNSDGIQIMDNGDFKLRVESGEKDDWIKYRHVVQELINRTNARYKLPYNLDVVVRYCGVGVTYAAYSPYYLDGRHLGVVLCAENLNRTANMADLYVNIVYKNIWKQYVKMYVDDFDAFKNRFTIYMLPAESGLVHGQTGLSSIMMYLWDSAGVMARHVNCMVMSHELVHAIAIFKYGNDYEGQIKGRAIHQTLHYYHGYGREGEREEGVQTVKVTPLSMYVPILGVYDMIDYAWIERKAFESLSKDASR